MSCANRMGDEERLGNLRTESRKRLKNGDVKFVLELSTGRETRVYEF
jgi:hypothetical protein